MGTFTDVGMLQCVGPQAAEGMELGNMGATGAITITTGRLSVFFFFFRTP